MNDNVDEESYWRARREDQHCGAGHNACDKGVFKDDKENGR